MRCAATAKQTGEQCKRAASPGRTVCNIHGGKTPRGAALPQTVTGRYSKDLPTRLAARYQEAITDPDLLNLTSEIQLTDTLLRDALSAMDRGEAGKLWRDLSEQWTALQEANRTKDKGGAAHALNQIGTLIKRGVADAAARDEVLGIMERRRRLVDSEGKRRVTMQQMITADRAMLLVTALVATVNRHVDDASVRAAISRDLGTLLDRPDASAA